MHTGPKIELSVFSRLGARVSQWVKGDIRASGVSQGAREESWGTLEAKGDVHWVQGGSRDTLGVSQGSRKRS